MDQEKIDNARQVKISTILGLADNGRKIFIRCPIHNEKSASMVIFPDGSYHCFGCGANGQNAIDFVMSMGGTFKEAIEELSRYG